MTEYKPASIPMNSRVVNSLLPYDRNMEKKTIKWYQSAIGSFMWPVIYTCPDIAYVMGVCSWYYSNPRPTYCNWLIQIFRYLSRILDFGITFTVDMKNKLVSYIDSNYAKLINGQKSTSSYIFMLSSRLLSLQLKLLSTVAVLLCKAEHMTITEAGKEVLWVARFLAYLRFYLPSQSINLRIDNKEVILLIKNLEFHWKTKHIKICWH